MMNTRFITQEHTQAMLREWKISSLQKYIDENINLSNTECLDKMVSRLQEIQSTLPLEC